MKFVLNKDSLLRPLNTLSSVANNKSTIPLLSCILFDINNNNLTITASDTNMQISYDLPVNSNQNIRLAIEASKINSIVRSLEDNANISFEVDNSKIIITSNNSKFYLTSLSSDNFPLIDENVDSKETNFTISQNDFYSLISKVDFSIAIDDTRHFLNGMFVKLEGNLLEAVATDGHRMAITETIVNSNNLSSNIECIFPRRSVLEIKKMITKNDELVNLSVNDNYFKASFNNCVFISKLIDGKYPDYEKIIPKRNSKHLTINKLAFKNSLTRTAILANNKFKGVRLNIFTNNILMSATNSDNDKAEENIEVFYNDESMEICFNYKYLLDIVSVIDQENIEIYLDNPNMSAIIKDEKESSKYIIMPMKI